MIENTFAENELNRYLDLVDDNKDFETRAEILKLSGLELSILNLSFAGNSTRSIAKTHDMSRSAVEKTLKKCEKLTKSLKDKYGS